jgi:predicted GIY-YIG superfamily endonuclease
MPSPATVYVLQSIADPSRYYTGMTIDLRSRLAAHNAGLSPHTADAVPWRVVVSIEFQDADRALEFEQYLKSGSGRAFANRHFR